MPNWVVYLLLSSPLHFVFPLISMYVWHCKSSGSYVSAFAFAVEIAQRNKLTNRNCRRAFGNRASLPAYQELLCYHWLVLFLIAFFSFSKCTCSISSVCLLVCTCICTCVYMRIAQKPKALPIFILRYAPTMVITFEYACLLCCLPIRSSASTCMCECVFEDVVNWWWSTHNTMAILCNWRYSALQFGFIGLALRNCVVPIMAGK